MKRKIVPTVLGNYIAQAVKTYWKHCLYLAGYVADFLLSHVTCLVQQMFLVGQVTKVLQMFVWVGRDLENKLWFSFLWLLQWFSPLYYLCFLWLWHLQLQHKLSGNKPLLQVVQGVPSAQWGWQGTLSSSVKVIRTWQSGMAVIEKMKFQYPLCSFSLRTSLYGLHVGQFCVCLLEIFAPAICRNFSPCPFLSHFTGQVAQIKTGNKAFWRRIPFHLVKWLQVRANDCWLQRQETLLCMIAWTQRPDLYQSGSSVFIWCWNFRQNLSPEWLQAFLFH